MGLESECLLLVNFDVSQASVNPALQVQYDMSNMKERIKEYSLFVATSLTTSSGLSALVWLQWWHTW